MSGFTEEGTPQISQIDAQWDKLLPMLTNRAGTQAGELLRNVREDDIGIFNALYWRVDRWMKALLGRRPYADASKGFDKVDLGTMRMSAFVQGRVSGVWWQTYDLGQMLSQIDGWDDEKGETT